ncbi:MAG: hypothetical protein ACT4PU_13370 [Planctomycetota bacterium]
MSQLARLTLAASLPALLAGCLGSPRAAEPLPAEPQPQPSTATPAPSDDYLETLRRDLANIRAGQPVEAAAPTASAAPTAGQPTVAPAPVPAPAPVMAPPPMPAPSPVQDAPLAPLGIPDTDLQAMLEASRQHSQLRDSRTAVLVAGFVEEGLAAIARGDYPAAYQLFGSAYELDPDDPAAAELYHRTGAILGVQGNELATIAAAARERYAALGDQTRVQILHHQQQGEAALARNDARTAIEAFENALALLRSSPDASSSGVRPADISARLNFARKMEAERLGQRDEELLAQAQAAEDEARRTESERQALRIEQLIERADSAFLNDDYPAAEAALAIVLEIDPEHVAAASLKRIAAQARHSQQDRNTRILYREQWQDTFDELEQDLVPQNDLVLFPDSKSWEQITERGEKAFGGSTGAQTELDRAVAERLEKRIPVNFVDEPLSEILKHLSTVTGANILMSPTVAGEYADAPYSLEDRSSQPVARILKILLEDQTSPPLSYTIRDGVVQVIGTDEARHDYTLEMYDIRDLTFVPSDYAAEDFNLLPSGTDPDSFQSGVEDEDPTAFIGEDALVGLIQDNIAPESWTEDPQRTIQTMRGTLVVRQTPDVHAQIRSLLSDLRRNIHTLIHIETRFVEVEDSFLEDIGVDLRGLSGADTNGLPLEDFGVSNQGGFGAPSAPAGIGTGNDPGIYYGGKNGDIKGHVENLFDSTLGESDTLNGAGGFSLQALFLDDTNVQAVLRAVTKYQTSNIVNAPSLTLRSGHRGNIKAITTRTYVRDFEPEIAQAAVIAQPELDNVKNGVILDVRAVASADRRFVTLEVRPTVADLIPAEDGSDINVDTISLGTGTGSDVELMLPELQIQRLRTTATIPDGSTLMLGGLKRSVEQDMSSGVPFLSDIPVLGSLFSRQGDYTSKRKLIILLTARILAPEEHEPDAPFVR